MILRIISGVLVCALASLAQQTDSAGTTTQAVDTLDVVAANHSAPIAKTNIGIGKTDEYKSQQHSWFSLNEGEAMKGVYSGDTSKAKNGKKYTTFTNLWQQSMWFNYSQSLTYHDRLEFVIEMQCVLDFSILPILEFPATLNPAFTFMPYDIEMKYTWGDFNAPWLKFALGYFPYKYNPDSKHLGEFLFRSKAYPTVIVSDLDVPQTRELGIHLGGDFNWLIGNPDIDKLTWDIMLTSETHDFPTLDGTLSGVISNSFLKFLDIGFGVSYQRLFSVDESKTTPKRNNSLPPDGNMIFNENGDTSYYSFKATKLMARAAINPQRFIPEFKIPPEFVFGKNPFFGKEDFKIYGEIAVLGLDNYTAFDSIQDTNGVNHWQKVPDSLNYYNNVKDRMPMMLGINLPTNSLISYGILPFILTKWLKDETGSDITQLAYVTLIPALASGVADYFFGWNLDPDQFSLEFEWFSQRFPNSNKTVVDPNTNYPMPISNKNRNDAAFGTPQPTKYAFNFKKTFMDRFAIWALVGRDHMKPTELAAPQNMQTDDFLQSSDHWWWSLRFTGNF